MQNLWFKAEISLYVASGEYAHVISNNTSKALANLR